MVPFLAVGTFQMSFWVGEAVLRSTVRHDERSTTHTGCAKGAVFLSTCCLGWSMGQVSARHGVLHVLESAKPQGF